jgi:Kef-type K+ transport system membrane component KefB
MTPAIHLVTSMLYLILLSRILGPLVGRLGQPPLIGEILAGIILGPALLHLVLPTVALQGVSKLALFLIMFSAGLEMDFYRVLNSFKLKNVFVALLAFFIPLVLGCLTGKLFSLHTTQALFLGLCISLTALPVTLKILENFNLLQTEMAQLAVSVSILNDVIALMALGVLIVLPEQKSLATTIKIILTTSLKLAIFSGLILLIYQMLKWMKRWVNIQKWMDDLVRVFGPEARFSLAVIFVLMFSTVSQNLGFHSLIGTFFGALLIDRNIFGIKHFSRLEETVNSISTGFLTPIYFAFLGLNFQPSKITSWVLLVVIIIVSFGSKLFAGYWGGKFIHLSETDAWGLGVILNGRGIMELAVANIALSSGMIGYNLFSILLLVAIITTLVTPFLFKRCYTLPVREA